MSVLENVRHFFYMSLPKIQNTAAGPALGKLAWLA